MIKIHKYGGTILKDENCYKIILDNILLDIENNDKVIIIVSAIGRNNDPYATDTLLNHAKNLDVRQKDRLITIGETISSLYLLDYLKGKKIKAYALDYYELGIKINGENFEVSNRAYFKLLEQFDVLIIPGFQGEDDDHYIKAMPRGGSDISAVLIAHMLNIKEVSLYKDVKGIMSGDPSLVATPRLIKYLSYDQCYLLSDHGGKIIQKEAIKLAKHYQIKITVKDFYTNKVGTIISKKGLQSKYYCLTIDNSKINILGEEMDTSKEEIKSLLDVFNIKLKTYNYNEGIITIQVEDGKRNFALNLLHHKFIS